MYRFIQRPGDLVWLNPGVVHWVQSSVSYSAPVLYTFGQFCHICIYHIFIISCYLELVTFIGLFDSHFFFGKLVVAYW